MAAETVLGCATADTSFQTPDRFDGTTMPSSGSSTASVNVKSLVTVDHVCRLVYVNVPSLDTYTRPCALSVTSITPVSADTPVLTLSSAQGNTSRAVS